MIADWVGIPYGFRGANGGLDCWQIIVRASYDIFGTSPPDYKYDGDEYEAFAMIMAKRDQDFVKINAPEKGCIVVFNLFGESTHCGLMLDSKNMLHTLQKRNSTIESISSPIWRSIIEGFYKWPV